MQCKQKEEESEVYKVKWRINMYLLSNSLIFSNSPKWKLLPPTVKRTYKINESKKPQFTKY